MNVRLCVGVQTFAHVWAIPTLWLFYFLAQLCLSDLFKDKRSHRQSYWPGTIRPCCWKRWKRRVREGGRRWIMWGGELKTQNNIREAVGTLQNFYLWLTLVWLALSSLPLSSCFDISSCGTLEKGEDTIQGTKLSANTDGRGCTAISEQPGSLRPLSPFGNNQGLVFLVCFLVKLPCGWLRAKEGGWLNAQG